MTDSRRSGYLVADEMRALAALGRRFAGSDYEAERAERLMELAGDVAQLAGGGVSEDAGELFGPDPWRRTTPALTVTTAVFDGDGRILLARRREDGHWVMPGGFAEVGLTAPEAALQELWEEAGLRGRVARLLGVFDARLWDPMARAHTVNLLFEVECEDLSPTPGTEMAAAGFFPPEGLPEHLAPWQEPRLHKALELRRASITYFDPSDSRYADMPPHQRR